MSLLAATQIAASAAAPLVGGLLAGKQNRKQAAYQDKLNKGFFDYQNAYNTPAKQMERFSEAGLNPNLIYGQGTPGNQSQPQQATTPNLPDWAAILGNSVNNLNTTLMQQTQRNLIEANTDKSIAQTATEGIKQSVMSANPLLHSDFLSSTIDLLRSQAKLKGLESKLMTQTQHVTTENSFQVTTRMQEKIDAEVNNLKQRFQLGQKDEAIKGEILNSKEMQNAILDVQKRFMTDFKLTPETWTQFVKILLTKLF